jgi:hypothetical protein
VDINAATVKRLIAMPSSPSWLTRFITASNIRPMDRPEQIRGRT